MKRLGARPTKPRAPIYAAGCAAVTTEFENVPAETLDYLAKFVPVRPSAAAVAVCQNRIAEKTFLRDHGLPHGPFAVIRTEADVENANASLFPAVMSDCFGRRHVGVLTGCSFALGCVPSALGPAVMGWVADHTGQYMWAFLGGTVVNSLVVLLFILARPPAQSPAPNAARMNGTVDG